MVVYLVELLNQYLVLGAEIVIECPFGNTRVMGYFIHRNFVETMLGEQRQSDVVQFILGFQSLQRALGNFFQCGHPASPVKSLEHFTIEMLARICLQIFVAK
jgi:hypothetical protein